MSETTLYKVLTYAGAVPFVACAAAPYVGIDTLGPLGTWHDVLLLYGVAIACFLAGTHWAFVIGKANTGGASTLIASNAMVVVVWLSTLVASVPVALGVQFLAFLVLLGIDKTILGTGKSSLDYYRTRRRITAIVLAALVVGISATWLA